MHASVGCMSQFVLLELNNKGGLSVIGSMGVESGPNLQLLDLKELETTLSTDPRSHVMVRAQTSRIQSGKPDD